MRGSGEATGDAPPTARGDRRRWRRGRRALRVGSVPPCTGCHLPPASLRHLLVVALPGWPRLLTDQLRAAQGCRTEATAGRGVGDGAEMIRKRRTLIGSCQRDG